MIIVTFSAVFLVHCMVSFPPIGLGKTAIDEIDKWFCTASVTGVIVFDMVC